jgi:hypothetical protein
MTYNATNVAREVSKLCKERRLRPCDVSAKFKGLTRRAGERDRPFRRADGLEIAAWHARC